MIHALLTTLLLAQGGPAHAALHPADADIFLEVGPVSALIPALEKTAMVGFLRDERVKPLFQDLGQSPERPFMDLLLEGLQLAQPELGAKAWLPGLQTISFSLRAIGSGTDEVPPASILLVADLASGEQAQALQGVVVAMAGKHEAMEGSLPGAQHLSMGDKPAEDVWCAVLDKRLVLANMAGALGDFAKRLEGGGAALAGSEVFQKELAGLSASAGVNVLWFALSRAIDEVLRDVSADPSDFALWGQIPAEFNPLSGARVARMQLQGNRFVTEMFSIEEHSGERKPVELSWLEPVPASAMFVLATAFDGAKAGKRMREVLAEKEGGDASLAALEQKLGFGPERVLGRLGPGMTVYAGPLVGIGLPEARAWIDCSDPAAFQADFTALVGALGETLPGFTVKTRDYKVKLVETGERKPIPITTLSLPPGLIQIPMISVSPSFAAVGNKLIFGLSSMDVKSELKRIYSGKGEPIVAGGNPLASMGFELPAQSRSVIVMDWGKLISGVLNTVKAFAGMAGPDAFPFDLAKLPPGEMFTQYFKPTFHYSKAVDGGLYRRNEASFGPETWFGIFGGVALLSMGQAPSSVAPVAVPPEDVFVPPAEFFLEDDSDVTPPDEN